MWANKAAKAVKTAIVQISRAGGFVSMVFLVAMMALTVTDVTLRFLVDTPVKGSLELTEYLMVITGLLGIAWCTVKDAHVRVDLLVSRLRPRVQTALDAFTLFLGMTVVPIVAWQGFAQIKSSMLERTVSEALEIPDYPFYGVVGFGYSLFFLMLIVILIQLIRKLVREK